MIRCAIITVSDSSSAGTREDRSGPALAQHASELGWQVTQTKIIPDEVSIIKDTLNQIDADVILTTGGTGIAPRDQTPEATRAIADREIPGFGELMRSEGLKKTRFAPLSRSAAFTKGATLILNL